MGDLHADCFLRFGGGAGDVRSKDDVVHPEVGRFLWRLDCKHIERCAEDLAALQGGNEIGVFNELAAGAVNDADALRHLCDCLRVDDAGCLRREANVEREVVRPCDKFVERDQLDAGLARYGRGDEGIAADEFEAESASTPGDFKADAAEAENAEGLAAQLRALQVLLVPLACVHGGVGGGELARESQHEPNGEFGDGNRICSGRVHDDDAAARCPDRS